MSVIRSVIFVTSNCNVDKGFLAYLVKKLALLHKEKSDPDWLGVYGNIILELLDMPGYAA